MIESQRLLWVRAHQKELRVDLYQGLADAVLSGETNGATIGYRDLFLTFTCNPAWPEIQRFFRRHSVKPCDRPDMLARIFKIKLDHFMKTIKEEKTFRTIRADIYTIKFQKEGLPHGHILLFLDPNDKIKDPEAINNFICAKIPNNNSSPLMYKLVGNLCFMDPAAEKLHAHINIEKCNHSTAIKYLFKYISKGNDRVVMSFHIPNQQYVIYSNHDDVAELLDKPRVCESQFLAWMEKNKTGQLYYLRVLLTKVRGPRSFDEIKTVDGFIHNTCKDACFSKGLLDDDQEYISANKEASIWASGHSLRKLFVVMLLCFSLQRLDFVWKETSKLLSEDVLYIHHNDPVSSRQIVLTVPSSGIAATLLPYGRTTHSRFAILIQIIDSSMCSIKQNSPLTNLITSTKVIIWGKAPMVQRFCVETFDRTLRDIMHCDRPFGGKCVIMGDDFRQILLVIPKGTRGTIVNACINSSYLWDHCIIFQLTKNMWLNSSTSRTNHDKLVWFSRWLLDVGDGKLRDSHDGVDEIEILDDLLILGYQNPIRAIVESTYINLLENIKSNEYFNDRAILAPTIEMINCINEHMCSMLPGEIYEFLSCDSVCKSSEDSDSFDNLYTT
ncbi:hypothetical protein K1719_016293 [Acacia pycnantha]|nr:hypothetical protein K1719_016293 [Acacia pycnantha]